MGSGKMGDKGEVKMCVTIGLLYGVAVLNSSFV